MSAVQQAILRLTNVLKPRAATRASEGVRAGASETTARNPLVWFEQNHERLQWQRQEREGYQAGKLQFWEVQ